MKAAELWDRIKHGWHNMGRSDLAENIAYTALRKVRLYGLQSFRGVDSFNYGRDTGLQWGIEYGYFTQEDIDGAHWTYLTETLPDRIQKRGVKYMPFSFDDQHGLEQAIAEGALTQEQVEEFQTEYLIKCAKEYAVGGWFDMRGFQSRDLTDLKIAIQGGRIPEEIITNYGLQELCEKGKVAGKIPKKQVTITETRTETFY